VVCIDSKLLTAYPTPAIRRTTTDCSPLQQRDKHLTFEDPKSMTGDPGLSTRSTQEWLDFLGDVKEHTLSQRELALTNTYSAGVGDSINGLSSSAGSSTVDSNMTGDANSHVQVHKGRLHKEQTGDVAGMEVGRDRNGRKRFSKRHSKNGLAAVF